MDFQSLRVGHIDFVLIVATAWMFASLVLSTTGLENAPQIPEQQ
nr:hypothetical protein [Clostridium aminobutyricum]